MTFRFPIEIAKDLVEVTRQFSKQSMEVHGIGLVSISFRPISALLLHRPAQTNTNAAD